eukprot:gene9973-20735_t
MSKSANKSNGKTPNLDDGDKAAEQYIKNCKLFELDIDPGVVIALKTSHTSRWKIMQPTKKLSEGGLLPLMGILEENDHIEKLNLTSAAMKDKYKSPGNGNSNARVLNLMLRKNSTVTDLDLSNTGIDDDGLAEICESLKTNKSITNINLSRNNFTSSGAENLREVLTENKKLKNIDVSLNALGYHTINSLQCACVRNNIQMNIQGNFVFEEVLNSVSHGVGFLLSVVGAILLMSETSSKHSTDYHFWASSYVLLILDHVGIYLLIAGSYTPFLLISLHESLAARILLVLMWMAALSGSVFTACSDQDSEFTHRVELAAYVILGFACVPIWNIFSAALVPASQALVVCMGAAYTFGIIFFIKGKEKPIYHVVWHLFVMLGAAFTWFNVYFFVVHAVIDLSKPS